MVLLLLACSFGRVKYTPCEASSECQAAFGWGHQCGATGLCEETPLAERCTRTVPEDLLDYREEYANAVVLGSVYWNEAFPLEVDALLLPFHEVNDEQGVGGTTLAIVQCANDEDPALDSLSQDEANVETSRYLAEDMGVPAIIGPPTSSQAEATYVTVAPMDTLVISPSATSPSLSTIDGLTHSDAEPGLFWRTAPPDDLQGKVIAQQMADRGVARAAILYQSGAYGEGLANVTTDEAGSTVSLDLFEFDDDTSRTQAVTEAASGYDAVLFISSSKPDTIGFLNSAGSIAGYDDVLLFLPDGGYDTQILASASKGAAHLFPNIVGTVPSTPAGDIYDFFKASFSAAYGGVDASQSGYTAHAYDASWLSIYALAWAAYNEDTITGTTLARGLRKVSAGTEIDIQPTHWNQLQAHFEDGESVDVKGASGELDYDPVTEETKAPIDVWAVNATGDGFVIIETVEP